MHPVVREVNVTVNMGSCWVSTLACAYGAHAVPAARVLVVGDCAGNMFRITRMVGPIPPRLFVIDRVA